MLPAISLPVGQRGEYRLEVGDGHDLVASDFVRCYDAHLERRPALADFERLLRNAPGTSVVGLIAAGALVGRALGRSKESALAGAAIGGIAALAGVAVANADGNPAISDVASKLLSTVIPIWSAPRFDCSPLGRKMRRRRHGRAPTEGGRATCVQHGV